MTQYKCKTCGDHLEHWMADYCSQACREESKMPIGNECQHIANPANQGYVDPVYGAKMPPVSQPIHMPLGLQHPLHRAFDAAVKQATKGKGERHGGDSIPFYDQQWRTLAECHGVGFLTGQASKKLNEAAQKQGDDDAWEREVLGALVYAGMALLKHWGYPK